MNGRFLLADAFICLPLVLILLLSAHFALTILPHLEAAEAATIETHYREIAQSVKDGEASGIVYTDIGERKFKNRLSRGAWGHEPAANGEFVWYHEPHAWRVAGVIAPEMSRTDYRATFIRYGVILLVIVLLLTGIGLRRFRRFAQQREEFMAAVAHDLTTPLVAMRYLIGKNDEDARNLNERLLLIVSNIMEFLRLGGKRCPPKQERINLASLLTEAYGIFREDYRDLFDGRDLEIAAPDGLFVKGDRTLLLQILWNLFGNDLKYAAPFGSVRIEAQQEAGRVVVRFIDEGEGLSYLERRRIFCRQYRAKGAKRSGKGGFGIGLSASRDFARAMGGDLTVEANVPKGCVFTLNIPLWI